MLAQSQQIAACNAVHSAEQRLCRWLVQSYERVADGKLHATQDSIGNALGIRRTTVTLLAQALQAQGLIQYRRGKITINDPERIEKTACECSKMLGRKHWPSTRLRESDNI
jgi:CRP-like cAMP-binding protein